MSAPEKPARILAIDDEERIRRALKSILSARKYEVVLAASGDEGIDRAIDASPDLVILDLTLPDRSGLEVCRELRTWLAAPILVLSVRSGETDKISALDEGADDYLTKPFSAGELLARIRALLRRASGSSASDPVIEAGDLTIDIARRRALRNEEEIKLTRTEFDILAFLAQNAGRVVTSKQLLQTVWGEEYGEDTQTLRVHIGHLRRKIEPHPSVPQYILTEPGVGYRFAFPSAS
jgi:two-component system KDP operon response regulator KdpE